MTAQIKLNPETRLKLNAIRAAENEFNLSLMVRDLINKCYDNLKKQSNEKTSK